MTTSREQHGALKDATAAVDAPRMRAVLRSALGCLLGAALAAGCTSAVPEPLPAPIGGGTHQTIVEGTHPAVAIVARLAGERGGTVPDVLGRSQADARALLAETGATVQVLAFGSEDRVSAQYPAAGATSDGHVTVWIGEPPTPPPPPPPARPEAAPALPPTSGAEVAAAPATPAEADPAPPPAPTTAPPAPPAGDPGPAGTGTRLEGQASWYGPGFAGRTTACGSRFDPEALTLASRELPCGTLVRVEGPDGKDVVATVTDWGPAEWTGRRFDLSAATFAALAPLTRGVLPVTVEILEAR